MLPADVYDTLELSALAYGGIGGGFYFSHGIPCCPLGHARAAGILWRELFAADINECVNDHALGDAGQRVSFEEWCRRLNVVRSEVRP